MLEAVQKGPEIRRQWQKQQQYKIACPADLTKIFAQNSKVTKITNLSFICIDLLFWWKFVVFIIFGKFVGVTCHLHRFYIFAEA